MKRSKSLKLLFLGLFILVLFVPIATSAYSGSYSFEISARVEGNTVHSLSNKSTSTTASGETYYPDNTINPNKQNFEVQLDGGWFTKYSVGGIKANNVNHTKSFGVVKSKDYTINVTKTTRDVVGEYIKGSGTIKQ